MNSRALAGLFAVGFAVAIVAAPGHAAECARVTATDRPKIGLVLGGGGARGAAHIGVIRLLQEMHIPIDYVAGTSMGALVGAFYATGMDAKQLEATVTAIDFDTLFKDATPRQDRPYLRRLDDNRGLFGPKVGVGPNSELLPLGAVHGQKISFLFESLIAQRSRQSNFDDLPIPYRAIATDLVTGDKVVLSSGDLAVAMRASMSVPGAFDPVAMGQYLLVDGGLADNVPIDVVRKMGADIVIAVDVGTPLEPRDKLKTFVSVTAQLSGLLVTRNSAVQIATLTDKDILIRPALGSEITSASFGDIEKAIPIGYQAAEAERAQLERLAITPAAYAEQRRFIESCTNSPQPVQFVKLDNRSRFTDAVIRERLHVPLGKPLDTAQLDKDIQQIYALGFLNLVRYDMTEENGETGVVIHITPDSRGTRFLEWGVDLFSDADSTEANLRLAVLNSALDDYGSEARVMVELGETPAFLAEMYKAIDPPLQIYIKPSVFAERRDLSSYDSSGHVVNTYRVTQFGGELDVLRELSRFSAVSVGVSRFSGDAQVDIGDPNLPDYSYNGAEYIAAASVDRLDDRYFPGSGTLASFRYVKSATSLGADEPYQQLQAQAITARSFGNNTLIGGIKYFMTVDNDAPIYALYRAGGLFNLSGLQPNQAIGQNFGEVLASYRYSLSGKGGLVPAYVGFSAEFGNTGAHHQDPFANGLMNGSIYFGSRTPIGPLYWGMGFSEGGDRVYFLRIGNVFGRSTIGR